MRFGGNHEEKESRGIGADLAEKFLKRYKLPLPRRHPHLLPLRDDANRLRYDDVGRKPEHLRNGLDARHIPVVVGTKNVYFLTKSPLLGLKVMTGVGKEICWLTILLGKYAVLVIPE